MTAPAIAAAVDPTGLNGERIHCDDTKPPHVVEIWVYRAEYSLQAIHDAWLRAPRRTYAVLGCKEYRVTAGRRFVQLDLVIREAIEDPRRVPHIEEPNV